MQISDEGESDVVMEEDNAEEQNVDVEHDSEDDEEWGEESEPEPEAPSPPPQDEEEEEPSPPPQPRLKIKLKLPAPGSTPTTATPTPAPEERPFKSISRRGPSRDIDIESEDDDDDVEYNPVGKPMTTRQAVLASVVDSSHVSLNESSKKKKTLNETELALRREETARKRRNLTEKKLEDEKMETINRLLKKQTRPRNKRNVTATSEDKIIAPEDEASVDAVAEPAEPPRAPTPPRTYRWISTSRSEGDKKSMSLTFSVPVPALPDNTATNPPTLNSSPPKCDIAGCDKSRKYKLVKDWTRGACGMEHLKALEAKLML